MIKKIFGQEVDLEKIKNKRIKIDVGCDMAAPHAAKWLHDDEECFVIAAEPNVVNLNYLKEGLAGDGMRDLSSFDGNGFYLKTSSNSIMKNNQEVKKYKKENLLLLPVAIDNVGNKIIKKTFFSFDGINSGCSSLCEPSEAFLNKINEEHNEKIQTYDVNCCSLEYILDLLELQNISQIDILKTDCQGKDLQVIESLGKYSNRLNILKTDCQGKDLQVIESLGKYSNRLNILKCEWNTKSDYKDSYTKSDVYNYEDARIFQAKIQQITKLQPFFYTDYDCLFINMKNEKMAEDRNYIVKSLRNNNNPHEILDGVRKLIINAPNQTLNDLRVLNII